MSVYQTVSTPTYRFCSVLSSFLQQEGLPFSGFLSEERIEQVFREADASFANAEQDPVYTPAITLWAFLSQVLFKAEQRSCLAAVSRVAVFLVAIGHKACSKNTDAYCRARAKMWNRIFERSNAIWASTSCAARPPRWSAKKSGPLCWRIISSARRCCRRRCRLICRRAT